MSRDEKKIYVIGAAAAVILICMILSVLFPEEAAAEMEPKMQETDIIEADFAEKPQNGTVNGRITANAPNALEVLEMSCTTIDSTTNQEINRETVEESETEEEKTIPIYRINGELPDPELQRMIWDALQAENISYWYEGSLAQCYQESHFRRDIINPRNGLDSGLFQYRSTYWDWSQGDIFDAGTQIRKYAAEMAARFNAGLSVDEAISRHKTSDYCTDVDWEYVQQVKQWLAVMEVENE